jgi:translin
MSLKKILSEIEKELKERKDIKDELYDAMRRATRLSKQATFHVHRGQVEEAERKLKEAKQLFNKLDEIPPTHRELAHAGIVDAALQEYSEAWVFLKLVSEGTFIGPEKMGVPSTSYLLGLADVVGELRRRVLDSLRGGDVNEAERGLEYMELIHDELMGLEEALQGVSELRRKTDVARRIIETTRGDVTIEARRNSLEHSIRNLEKTIKAGKKKGR